MRDREMNFLFNLSQHVCDADLESPDTVVSFLVLCRADMNGNHVFRRDAETRIRAEIGATDPMGGN
jgi:hypothetical protein